MILIFLGVVLCVLLGFGVYAGLISSGILPNERSGANLSGIRSSASRTSASSDSGMFGVFPRVPHVFELPQGCLIALIVAAVLWVVAWGVVLVLALKLLRST
ncbi:MAG: hypothetical protein ACR2G7_04210 [Acidimicrobiales bacterium]